jgi:Protein kinase domain
LKHAGFKPITQTNSNSALKKFFPGDDDDMELASDDQLMSSSSAGPGVEETTHESDTSFHTIAHDDSSHRGRNRHSLFQTIEKNASRNGMPSSPPQDPSPSLVDKTAADDAQRLKSPGSQERPELDSSEIPVTPSVGAPGELYKIISQVGEGTFGKVYKAQNTVTKLHVALKRIRMESEKDGFPVTAMREIKLLQSLRHANVVQLYEMMVSNGENIVPHCKHLTSLLL